MLGSTELHRQLIKPQRTLEVRSVLLHQIFMLQIQVSCPKWAMATGAGAHQSPVLIDIPKPSKDLDLCIRLIASMLFFNTTYSVFWEICCLVPA